MLYYRCLEYCQVKNSVPVMNNEVGSEVDKMMTIAHQIVRILKKLWCVFRYQLIARKWILILLLRKRGVHFFMSKWIIMSIWVSIYIAMDIDEMKYNKCTEMGCYRTLFAYSEWLLKLLAFQVYWCAMFTYSKKLTQLNAL